MDNGMNENDIQAAKKGYKKLAIIILFVALILFVKICFIENITVSGHSMEPMFHEDDVCLQVKNGYELDRFDVVVVHENGFYMIKRIIALPNETIQIIDGMVYVNGTQLVDDHGELIEDAGCAAEPLVLSDTQYFVMGDNRNQSGDSREWGAVSAEEIDGKVIVRILPLDAITTDFNRRVQ